MFHQSPYQRDHVAGQAPVGHLHPGDTALVAVWIFHLDRVDRFTVPITEEKSCYEAWMNGRTRAAMDKKPCGLFLGGTERWLEMTGNRRGSNDEKKWYRYLSVY